MFARLKGKEEALKEIFRDVDNDGNGFIESNELRRILDSIGDEVVDKLIADSIILEADTDRDGKVNYKEFAALMLECDNHNS